MREFSPVGNQVSLWVEARELTPGLMRIGALKTCRDSGTFADFATVSSGKILESRDFLESWRHPLPCENRNYHKPERAAGAPQCYPGRRQGAGHPPSPSRHHAALRATGKAKPGCCNRAA
jgi:hypothetical protein